jgi:hypothetical protein
MIVNPYDAEGVARALREALDLAPEESAARIKPMRERVLKYDARHWARTFVDQLRSGREESAVPKDDRLEKVAQELQVALEAGKIDRPLPGLQTGRCGRSNAIPMRPGLTRESAPCSIPCVTGRISM